MLSFCLGNWFLEASSKGLVLECDIGLINELAVAFVRMIALSSTTKNLSFRNIMKQT
jgi:hypothetical protein